MPAPDPGLRYEAVSFEFFSADEDYCALLGIVIVRDGRMVLNVTEGDDAPYSIVGRARGHWFEGGNDNRDRQWDTTATWAYLNGTYVGVWVEDGHRYLFSFQLGRAIPIESQA